MDSLEQVAKDIQMCQRCISTLEELASYFWHGSSPPVIDEFTNTLDDDAIRYLFLYPERVKNG